MSPHTALIDTVYVLRGVAIGFAIAAPVGPIGLLCIQRTLAFGRLTGLATGLGAATADTVYGFIAAFGLSVITDALTSQAGWLAFVGAAFLVFLGVKAFLTRPPEAPVPVTNRGLAGAYASSFLLTLANPLTIVAFVGIFAGLGLADGGVTYAESGALVLGVFAGSALWWVALSAGVGLVRGRFDAHALRWVNRASGIIILAFAAAILARRW